MDQDFSLRSHTSVAVVGPGVDGLTGFLQKHLSRRWYTSFRSGWGALWWIALASLLTMISSWNGCPIQPLRNREISVHRLLTLLVPLFSRQFKSNSGSSWRPKKVQLKS